MKKKKISQRWNDFIKDIKGNPDAMKSAVMSFFVMGLGQFRNKQKAKGFTFLGIGFFAILTEFLTGGYFYLLTELSQYPADPGGQIYLIRDYGGIFSKGLWGLVTLGKVVRGVFYRGQLVETFNKVIPWLSADNSITLLGQGLIALVLVSIIITIWIYNIRDAYVSRKTIMLHGHVETGKAYVKRLWSDMFPYIILLAFTNYTYRIPLPSRLVEWVAFKNFTMIVTDPGWFSIFSQILGWTFFYAIMASATCYIMGLIQAMVIESKYVRLKKFWRTIMIVPWAVPAMISLMVFRNVFDNAGLANQLLLKSGLMTNVSKFLYYIGLQGRPDEVISWLTVYYNGNLAKFVVILVNLWLGAPYFMMLVTGVLTTLPKDLYEAAAIDGASKWQAFRKITIPLILRATLPAIIMTFTYNFNNFGAIYFLTGGGPAYNLDKIPMSMQVMGGIPGQTDILISWIYKLSFSNNAQLYNIAAVYSILIFIFIGFISVYNLSRSKGLWEED
jgi:arabinogalactan oligomer/maltooligosaccharide transport system permease protein